MLFNSWEFIAFLSIVLVTYFSLPFRYRVWFLLGASYYFYMCWQWEYIFLIVAQTVVNFEAGRRIGATSNKSVKKAWLSFSLISSIGLLAFFKYYNLNPASGIFRGYAARITFLYLWIQWQNRPIFPMINSMVQ